MIEQHYYTRDKKGMFSKTPGFDTVAVSTGLKNRRDCSTYVRTVLHDKCFYDAPKGLSNKSDVDISEYPDSLICFNPEKTGEMILGRAAYVGKDFTGERNRFFQHNYIISEEDREKYIKNVERIVYSSGYATDYDIEKGQEIESLNDIPFENKEIMKLDRQKLFMQMNIKSDEIFKKIIYSVINSMVNKRRVLISLDVETKDISTYGRELIKYILKAIPYEIRRNMGFVTYEREPISKRNINVMIVQKGGMKLSSPEIKKEYIFDFAEQVFLNTDIDINNYPYIEYVLENINKDEELNNFYEFLDEKIKTFPYKDKFNLNAYNDLCVFYLLEKGDVRFYEKDRNNVFVKVFNYLNNNSYKSQWVWFDKLFIKLFEKELNDLNNIKEYLPSFEIEQTIISYYSSGKSTTMDTIKNILIFLITSIDKGISKTETDYVYKIFNKAYENEKLYKSLIDTIFMSDSFVKNIFEWYIKERIVKIQSLRDLIKEVDFWGKTSSKVIKNEFFISVTYDKFIYFLSNDKDMYLDRKNIHIFLNSFCDHARLVSEKTYYKNYKDKLSNEVDDYVFRNIDIKNIALEDIKELGLTEKIIDKGNDALSSMYYLTMIDENKFDVLNTEMQNNFKKISLSTYNIFISRIKNFYTDDIKSNRFDRIVYGFYKDEYFDYDKIIDYILDKFGKESVYEYVLWSTDNNVFLGENQDGYTGSLETYFCDKDRLAFRNRKIKKKLLEVRNLQIKALFYKLSKDLASPLKKFIMSKTGIITLSTVTVVILGVGIASSLKIIDINPFKKVVQSQETKPKDKIVNNKPFSTDKINKLKEKINKDLEKYNLKYIYSINVTLTDNNKMINNFKISNKEELLKQTEDIKTSNAIGNQENLTINKLVYKFTCEMKVQSMEKKDEKNVNSIKEEMKKIIKENIISIK